VWKMQGSRRGCRKTKLREEPKKSSKKGVPARERGKEAWVYRTLRKMLSAEKKQRKGRKKKKRVSFAEAGHKRDGGFFQKKEPETKKNKKTL